MTRHILANTAIVSLALSVLLGLGPQDTHAQTLAKKANPDLRIAQSDGVAGKKAMKGKKEVPGVGKTFFPGDHFSRAFPGDHFSPKQTRTLESQGIKTLADFMMGDAAVIGRLVGENPRAVRQWQQEINGRLR